MHLAQTTALKKASEQRRIKGTRKGGVKWQRIMKKIMGGEAYRSAEMRNADTAWRKRREASTRCPVPYKPFFPGIIVRVKLDLLCVFINILRVGNPLYFQRIEVVDSFVGGKWRRLLLIEMSRNSLIFARYSARTTCITYHLHYLWRTREERLKAPHLFPLFFSKATGNDLLCLGVS